ncbi:hypothetical protein DL93DRAFT_2077808 [Clavulina sp. PMI_390]|nr:hypothetical protein DL93DRAFT_2077808 [Clavulina sp. PMI_390]
MEPSLPITIEPTHLQTISYPPTSRRQLELGPTPLLPAYYIPNYSNRGVSITPNLPSHLRQSPRANNPSILGRIFCSASLNSEH